MTQLQASCKRILKKQTKRQWNNEWKVAPTGQDYRVKYGSAETKTGDLYKGLPKALAAILIQLRTGKVALAAYLHKIKKAPSPGCECNQANQTVAHVLKECPQYQKLRRQELGRPVIRSAVETLSEPATAKKAA
jgi:hypothetical protein